MVSRVPPGIGNNLFSKIQNKMKEWIVGRNPVFEALKAKRRHFFRLLIANNIQEKGRITEIIKLSHAIKIRIEHVPRDQLNTKGQNHQGIALETSGYTYHSIQDILGKAYELNEAPFILILDSLQDPQNLGTLIRTAEIIGVHGVILPLRRTATITPAVVSSSSGASEHIMISQANLSQMISYLQEQEVWVLGLEDSTDAQELMEINLTGPLAIVVGSEGTGMRSLVRKSCDQLTKLPMRGQIESLNAAVAGSIALYIAWQVRGFTGKQGKTH